MASWEPRKSSVFLITSYFEGSGANRDKKKKSVARFPPPPPPAPLLSPDWAPLVILHLRWAPPSGKWFNPLNISRSISAFHWSLESTRPGHVSPPAPASRRHHRLKLFNDGFRQQRPLLITHSYLHAGFIADALRGAAAKLQSHWESCKTTKSWLVFLLFISQKQDSLAGFHSDSWSLVLCWGLVFYHNQSQSGKTWAVLLTSRNLKIPKKQATCPAALKIF